MDKSPEAFRTISEVADLLETPAHVLRFWESRFPQIRPVKRAGGRRYYRPADVALLSGIKHLLHDEGLTIRGVQKMLREQGVRHVAAIGDQPHGFEDDAEAALQAALAENFAEEAEPAQPEPAQPETAQIVPIETAMRKPAARQAERPVQENLFSDLFDTPPAPPPPPLFVEVSEALAGFDAQSPEPDPIPEAPMASDVEADDAGLADTVVALVAADRGPEAPAPLPAATAPGAGAAQSAVAAPASLADRIIATPRRRLAAHRETLRVLRDRLIRLEDRMIGPRY